ncbi:molybdenum cofactor biosynthesis protein MoaE [Chryseobacterium indologenes]|uniref:Molybdopterin synthase catalytic subunit n=1 Tax=Chryseobacterium indologenes TaxID=253 RepID=A0AAD0YX64_CHRID|nr:molybdenum cofactor biosynthesis protein MoaE [Chryseobacterium indologenes]ASE60814.1 molybdenum cofactor biosynthesis protein MoaE [Chryseobacterium indologenes]ATN04926.1 molybdenum cofactor biosynthesis protein MoaE [Chryseobacterium indologenes]AYY86323.1 molybdenum cofactor biosynthesis protein MoaE [Chryseobacterium indologenes]AZB16509.1 molybdenum cofactor biosynthesis protein MoaE [Chryseobacterium indologenes]QIX83227.1 molybdenum cofactor biosynthesis protein MoaE [Chryseobacter
MIDIRITDNALSITECLDLAQDLGSGGIATFIGTVRNMTKNKPVIRLDYECYQSMATKEIKKIVDQAIIRFSVRNVVVHHRTGTLLPGDAAVMIVVSDGHRDAVFDACRYIIDTVKQTVPIWKKEIFEDGEEWVSAHP